jgi:hypothetical protein
VSIWGGWTPASGTKGGGKRGEIGLEAVRFRPWADGGGWVAFLVSAVTVIGTLGALALVVLAILKGREGRFLRYPFCVRLIK